MSDLRVSLKAESSVITKGTTPTSLGHPFMDAGVPFIRAQNLVGGSVSVSADPLFISIETNEALKRSKIQAGDVLISIAGTIGRAAIVPSDAEEMNCNQAVAIVRPSNNIDRRYLLHWLSSDDALSQMARGKVTGVISNLSLGEIGKLQIPLPPLEEQKRIAGILDQADALRRLRTRALDKLGTLGQAIFHEMFGDVVTNSRGFKEIPLTEALNFRTGKLDSNAAVDGGEFPFFTCAKEISSINNYAFDCEALLLAGNNASADYDVKHYDGKFNAYQRTYVLTIADDSFEYEFVQRSLETMLGEMKRFSKGSNTKYLTMEIFRRMTLCRPEIELQKLYIKRAQALSSEKQKAGHAVGEAETLFASLQHRAFRGEL